MLKLIIDKIRNFHPFGGFCFILPCTHSLQLRSSLGGLGLNSGFEDISVLDQCGEPPVCAGGVML